MQTGKALSDERIDEVVSRVGADGQPFEADDLVGALRSLELTDMEARGLVLRLIERGKVVLRRDLRLAAATQVA